MNFDTYMAQSRAVERLSITLEEYGLLDAAIIANKEALKLCDKAIEIENDRILKLMSEKKDMVKAKNIVIAAINKAKSDE